MLRGRLWQRLPIMFLLLIGLVCCWGNVDPTIAQSAGHLWVDAVSGSDANTGLSAAAAFRTIQKAASVAGAGTTIHILPGVYRESIRPSASGSSTAPIRYVAENGAGTAIVRGSEPSSSLTWVQLTANTIGLPAGVNPSSIYYADLSAWGLSASPRFVVQLDGSGDVLARLPLAREPDWQVATEWKYHEFWWAADGGWAPAGCDPATDPDPWDCDAPWRSATQLTDRTTDSEPAGIEPGNLTTLADLTGGTAVMIDGRVGHYAYRRTITAHDRTAGRITISPAAGNEGADLSWGTKYYVEGKPGLLDNPGEWWYDHSAKRLYLWPPVAGDPAGQNIEISRRASGFDLSNRSHITLDGLRLELFNANAVEIGNGSNQKSYGVTVRNVTIQYANRGIVLDQGADGAVDNAINGFTLENSHIAYMDTNALNFNYWWANSNHADSFTHSGIVNTIIRNNEFDHLGFRSDSDNAVGASILYADKLRFEGNHVHHVAHNGIQFSYSVIQSSRQYGFTPQEIKTGDILIQDNVFEKTCQLTTDCGALKFWGDPPDKHVYRNVLITGNVFRNTFGWSHIAQERKLWSGGTGSAVQGMGGFGLYLNMTSGMHVYRNIAYNNAYADFQMYGLWRDDNLVYYNNIAANSLHGFYLAGIDDVPPINTSTPFFNNIMINNENYGIVYDDSADCIGGITNLNFDHNLYYGNGWSNGIYKPGVMIIYRGAYVNSYYQTLSQMQADTAWEDHGVAGDPLLRNYDLTDRDLFDDSWPDFRLTGSSVNAIDRGTVSLHSSLNALLTQFEVADFRSGAAFDIGRYESGFTLVATPQFYAVNPGGVAQYALQLEPPDTLYAVTLSVTNPSPYLTLHLEPITLTAFASATLVVTNTHSGPTLIPGLRYAIAIIGSGGGLQHTQTVYLLVGGTRHYLPLIFRR
jgi:hypothetical protein